MSPKQLFDIIRSWLSHSYLCDENICFDEKIYAIALENFIGDYFRWYPDDNEINTHKLMMTPQLHPILTYRIARQFYLLKEDEYQASLFSLIGRIQGLMEIFYSARIGKGLKINHGVGCVIGARCVLGDNCLLHQGVTLGDKNGGRPTIGNNVIIYANASILGNIHIGDNSIIGANAVCMQDMPANAICVGAPARNIN